MNVSLLQMNGSYNGSLMFSSILLMFRSYKMFNLTSLDINSILKINMHCHFYPVNIQKKFSTQIEWLPNGP